MDHHFIFQSVEFNYNELLKEYGILTQNQLSDIYPI